MLRKTTLERIHSVLCRSLSDHPNIIGVELTDATPLDSLGLDSLTVLDLIYDLQQEFQSYGDVRDLAGLRTVGELADYLESDAAGRV